MGWPGIGAIYQGTRKNIEVIRWLRAIRRIPGLTPLSRYPVSLREKIRNGVKLVQSLCFQVVKNIAQRRLYDLFGTRSLSNRHGQAFELRGIKARKVKRGTRRGKSLTFPSVPAGYYSAPLYSDQSYGNRAVYLVDRRPTKIKDRVYPNRRIYYVFRQK